MTDAANTQSSGAQEHGNMELRVPEHDEAGIVQRRLRGRRVERRVAIACTVCRKQHLRCDAAMPSCSRCRSLGKRCVYTDIRRPRRNSRKMLHIGLPQASHENDENELTEEIRQPPGQSILTAGESQGRQGPESALAQAKDDVYPRDTPADTIDTNRSPSPSIPPSGALQDLGTFRLIMNDLPSSVPLVAGDPLSSIPLDGFYTCFFPAHPFVLPRAQLACQHGADTDSVSHLIAIMTLIGALYTHDKQSHNRRQDAERILDQTLPPTGFTVQTLMLLALCLEWSGDGQRASDTLQRAKDIALEIGMDRKSYAVDLGNGNPVLQESWRRTWWELYVIDALFAGIRHWPTFSLWRLGANVDLPADEEYYISKSIPQPRTLQEYDDRCFQEDEDLFSSFAYLIDAARILGTTLGAGDIASGSPSSLVKNAEANLLSWELHLPQCKRDPVRWDGSVDEVLFRAHLMINTVAIHLHRPRSALHYTTMELLSSKYAPPLPAEVIPAQEAQPDRHTNAAIRASKAFVDLLAAPSPPISHTPFVMCMGSMAVVTHLSACEYRLRGTGFEHARDRIRVFLGVLRTFGGVWPQATKWGREIRMMAKVVFEGRDSRGQLVLDPSIEGEATAGGAVPENTLDNMESWSVDASIRLAF